MSFNVRLFGYSGIVQVGQPNADQFSGGAVFLNEEPCLWSQLLVCDGSTVATSARITTVPDGTQMVCVEVPDNHEIRYEVVQPGVAARAVSSDSRRGSGSFNLAWNPGYTLSIIDAVPVVVAPPAPPGPLALTGLIGWWDASVFASMTFSGANVLTVADQSGAGNNVTAATSGGTGPAYSATSFNSRPGFTFDAGGNTGLAKASFPLGTGNTLTIFAVAQLTNTAAPGSDFGRFMSYSAAAASHDYDNNGSFTLVRDAATSNVSFGRNSLGPSSVAYGYATPRRIIVTMKSDGTAAMYIDGVATSAAAAAANWVSLGGMYLGYSEHDSLLAAGRLVGVIGEAGIATGYSDATAVAALDLYLKNKWGL